jgi:hypothetical protein
MKKVIKFASGLVSWSGLILALVMLVCRAGKGKRR